MRLMTLDDLVEEYSKALARLESWGVRVRGTRLDAYLKRLQRAASRELAGEETHQADDGFRNALIEASDIIDLARLDRELLADDHVLEKLRHVSDRREFAEDEGHDAARDYAFEFACAGELHASGRFAGFSTGAGDVLVAPDRWPVEVKRVSSLDRLRQRLRKARDQLQRGFEAGSPPGLIAVDLSRPIRRVHGHLAAESDHALVEATSRTLTAYIGEHLIGQLDPDDLARPGVLGIMVRYVSVGTAGAASSVRRSTTWQMVCLHPDGSPENDLFLRAGVLGGSAPIVDGTVEELFAARYSILR